MKLIVVDDITGYWSTTRELSFQAITDNEYERISNTNSLLEFKLEAKSTILVDTLVQALKDWHNRPSFETVRALHYVAQRMFTKEERSLEDMSKGILTSML